mmetsp:Transcript_20006/g.31864  ORF Transcript_20006/g.31864 Transcript_20006/m.31864 type:complete len:261 (+) Transcript_20006:259-1041(+)
MIVIVVMTVGDILLLFFFFFVVVVIFVFIFDHESEPIIGVLLHDVLLRVLRLIKRRHRQQQLIIIIIIIALILFHWLRCVRRWILIHNRNIIMVVIMLVVMLVCSWLWRLRRKMNPLLLHSRSIVAYFFLSPFLFLWLFFHFQSWHGIAKHIRLVRIHPHNIAPCKMIATTEIKRVEHRERQLFTIGAYLSQHRLHGATHLFPALDIKRGQIAKLMHTYTQIVVAVQCLVCRQTVIHRVLFDTASVITHKFLPMFENKCG